MSKTLTGLGAFFEIIKRLSDSDLLIWLGKYKDRVQAIEREINKRKSK